MDEALKNLLEAGCRLVSAMEMQEEREAGNFHIPQPTAAVIWERAKSEWAEAVKVVRDREIDLSKPAGWITPESISRLGDGGNGARGTVPIHAVSSSLAYLPVYIGKPLFG